MKSIDDFVRQQVDIVRQKELKRLPALAIADAKKPIPIGMSRRGFLKSFGATMAVAACFIATDMAIPDFARAANAVVYVNSAAGGSNNGTSWVNAYTSLATAVTNSGTTGTDFYMASGHSEALAAGLSFKGVSATPDRVFSCDTTNSPPQTSDLTIQTGGFTSASGVALGLSGNVYIYGMKITVGTAVGNAGLFLNNVATGGYTFLDTCTTAIGNTNTSSLYTIGASTTNGALPEVTLLNTTLQFGAVGQFLTGVGGNFRWYNTASAIQGATLPTNLISAASTTRPAGTWILDGVDLSALSAKTIIAAGATFLANLQVLNCRLPASITLAVTPSTYGCSWDFLVTDSAAVNTSSFIQTRYQYSGTLTASGSVYNNATDGVNPMSWQVVTNANCSPQQPFECFEIAQWAAAGTYAASKIFATSATGALTNNDIWARAEYMSSASSPLAVGISSGPTNQIPQGSSGTTLTTGATWGTGGLGTNYVLSTSASFPSFTTALAGYVRFIVFVGKPSLTINIDPAVTIA